MQTVFPSEIVKKSYGSSNTLDPQPHFSANPYMRRLPAIPSPILLARALGHCLRLDRYLLMQKAQWPPFGARYRLLHIQLTEVNSGFSPDSF